jgi:hypothetical protein
MQNPFPRFRTTCFQSVFRTALICSAIFYPVASIHANCLKYPPKKYSLSRGAVRAAGWGVTAGVGAVGTYLWARESVKEMASDWAPYHQKSEELTKENAAHHDAYVEALEKAKVECKDYQECYDSWSCYYSSVFQKLYTHCKSVQDEAAQFAPKYDSVDEWNVAALKTVGRWSLDSGLMSATFLSLRQMYLEMRRTWSAQEIFASRTKVFERLKFLIENEGQYHLIHPILTDLWIKSYGEKSLTGPVPTLVDLYFALVTDMDNEKLCPGHLPLTEPELDLWIAQVPVDAQWTFDENSPLHDLRRQREIAFSEFGKKMRDAYVAHRKGTQESHSKHDEITAEVARFKSVCDDLEEKERRLNDALDALSVQADHALEVGNVHISEVVRAQIADRQKQCEDDSAKAMRRSAEAALERATDELNQIELNRSCLKRTYDESVVVFQKAAFSFGQLPNSVSTESTNDVEQEQESEREQIPPVQKSSCHKPSKRLYQRVQEQPDAISNSSTSSFLPDEEQKESDGESIVELTNISEHSDDADLKEPLRYGLP